MYQLDNPGDDRTIKFLGDLIRQVRKGVIVCDKIDKISIQSTSDFMAERPLVTNLDIQLRFNILRKPNGFLVST